MGNDAADIAQNHVAVLGRGGADRKAQDRAAGDDVARVSGKDAPMVTTARCAGATFRHTML